MMFEREAPFRQELLHKIRLFSSEYLTSLLIEGKERGEIRKDVDVKVAVFLLDAVMDRFLQAYTVPFLDSEVRIYKREKEIIEQRINDIIEILKNGLLT
jgi:hypothetical protein